MSTVHPPYTPDQIESFNQFQESGCFHEYTCAHDHRGACNLVAQEDGLHCPTCDYVQTWAAGFLLDWGWRPMAAQEVVRRSFEWGAQLRRDADDKETLVD